MSGEESVTELQDKLNGCQESLQQLEEGLILDPNNEELKVLKQSLLEGMQVIQELLKEKLSNGEGEEPQFEVGAEVTAKYSVDGVWYDATLLELTEEGLFRVQYKGYGNEELLPPSSIKAKDKKRKAADDADLDGEDDEGEIKIPKALQIKPTDSEEVKQQKKRKQKAFRNQQRLKKLEEERNLRKNAWLQFTTKKVKPKVGYFTGKKKESIFKSPDSVDGKVGVTGSGKGMTPIQEKRMKVSKKPGVDSELQEDSD
eukprot:TRINITY_DN2269_c0_g1_i2.p1 TRINITY_DN2269_c0_g1~~TRINITY_DN2269_c0_g1_i2.p1  ORF type:complete len:257 (+),score=59.84 TRINITY_DN2269_c0_g1_i2:57-827(+)